MYFFIYFLPAIYICHIKQKAHIHFFLKVFLTGGGASTAGLTSFINEKLNIECAVFNPFETMAGAEELSISNPSQYTTALGLGIRGGMTSG